MKLIFFVPPLYTYDGKSHRSSGHTTSKQGAEGQGQDLTTFLGRQVKRLWLLTVH